MERNCLWQNHPLSQVSPTFTEKVTKKSTKSKLLKRSKKILKVIHVAERNWLLQNQVYLFSFNGNTTHFCIVWQFARSNWSSHHFLLTSFDSFESELVNTAFDQFVEFPKNANAIMVKTDQLIEFNRGYWIASPAGSSYSHTAAVTFREYIYLFCTQIAAVSLHLHKLCFFVATNKHWKCVLFWETFKRLLCKILKCWYLE